MSSYRTYLQDTVNNIDGEKETETQIQQISNSNKALNENLKQILERKRKLETENFALAKEID